MITRPLAVAALGLIGFGGPAWAHAHLKAAQPSPNGIVAASPSELDLSFSERLELAFTGVTVTGPDKHTVATGAAALKPGDGTVLVVPLAGTLGAGAYTVDWHALSADGHKTSGTYTFRVAP